MWASDNNLTPKVLDQISSNRRTDGHPIASKIPEENLKRNIKFLILNLIIRGEIDTKYHILVGLPWEGKGMERNA